MNQEELDALLVEVDMPRAVDVQIEETWIKLRIDFARPEDPIKIAEAYGQIAEAPNVIQFMEFANQARRLVEEKRPSLVPYDSIYRADNDNAPALEVSA